MIIELIIKGNLLFKLGKFEYAIYQLEKALENDQENIIY